MSDDEQVAELLGRAASIVDRAGLPSDIRPVAYAKAVEALSGASVAELRGPGATDPIPPRGHGEKTVLEKIADRLQVQIDVLGDVYEERDGEVMLVVSKSMLPGPHSKAAAMRQVALLVGAGRQGAELEEWTSFKRIREECDELGVLDRVNFATEVGKLGMRTQGQQQARELRLARHHFDEAAKLLKQIAQPENQR